ncbi:AraC family transcriptional regulator [Capsulimonas corticalis]|uniref:AraC family transcriptional regulator n=1 Tax=Capsulimonas corticalis TaxID=2219043 RepID=A0A402D053_9BACT|nr:AraC family transcriptional regulator [Capsulimonas corticalis]BDI33716.1 AraC family transcriptional regulator [Capsulimonas corticalis]
MPVSLIHYADSESGERLSVVPESSLLLSSADAGWKGIIVEQFRLPPMEPRENLLPDHLLTLHLSPSNTLEWKSGKQYRSRSMAAGDVCLVPAGVPRDLRWHEAADVLAIAIDPHLVANVARETVHADRIELVESHGGLDLQVQYLGLALKAELESGSLGGPLFAESLATALAVHLLRRYNAFPEPILDGIGALSRPKLRRVIDYIDAHLHRNLTLAEMAAVAQISPYYFSRQFKQATGASPYDYVLRRRIERARTLLRSGRFSVGEVAQQLGFSDQSHFTRHFKRLTGQTPRAFLQETAR